jgi:serine/threonine protein phosphatase PrpC
MADGSRTARRKRPRSDDDTQVLELPPEVKLRMAPAAPRASIRLSSGVVSSSGILRRSEPDEDSVLCIELCRILEGEPNWLGFYAVADGMGGQEAGEVASRVALEALSQKVLECLGTPWLAHAPLTQEDILKRLSDCVEAAHQRVRQENTDSGGRDMGTTLTAALVIESTFFVLNVGDSRVYLFTAADNELRRISRDQSLVQQLVEAGEITEDEVYTDPRRNIILSSLGGDTLESGAEFFSESFEPGDKLLLCSDGLWEMIRDHDLLRVIDLKVDPQQCAEDLATLACINGGVDNVSAIVVERQARKRI